MGKYPLQYAMSRKSGSIVFAFRDAEFMEGGPVQGTLTTTFPILLRDWRKAWASTIRSNGNTEPTIGRIMPFSYHLSSCPIDFRKYSVFRERKYRLNPIKLTFLVTIEGG
jgi:hypothetical protein